MFVLSRSKGTMKVELALSGEEERDGPTTVVGQKKCSQTKELQTSAYLYVEHLIG